MAVAVKLCFAACIVFIGSAAKKSQNMNPIDVSEWGLPVDEKYSTIYQLSKESFKPKVLFSRDAWVVVVYKEKLHGKWRRHAEHLIGSVWYGAINFDKEKELAENWVVDLTEEKLKAGVALVFPYGKSKKENLENIKRHWPRQVYEPKEAENILKKNIPDHIEKFTFKSDNMEKFQKWILNAFYDSQPPKFPVLCITDEPEPEIPITLLTISNYFSTFFSFGLVRKPNVDNLAVHFKQVPPPKSFPHYLVLLGKEPSQEDMRKGEFGMTFNIFPFLNEKYGSSDQFQSVVKYLFTANEDYREVLPGRRSDEPAGLISMAMIRKALTNRLKEVSMTYKPARAKNEL